MSQIRRIEIDFALPVELTDVEYRALDRIVSHICKRSCPPGWAFWPAGSGSKPNFSQADLLFLGLPPNPDAPASGEPTWDDTIYHIDCSARPLTEEEIEQRRVRAEEALKTRNRWDSRLADWFHRRGMKRISWWIADFALWCRRVRHISQLEDKHKRRPV